MRYEGLDAFRVVSSFYVVFGHVYTFSGSPDALKSLFQAVTFSFPIIVMSSFFLLTRALLAKPDIGFGKYFSNSVRRLWIPFFVWTVIYSLMWSFIFPAIRGYTSFAFPSVTRLFSGYMHLWFLEFLFLGSLLFYLMLKWCRNRKFTRLRLVAICLSLTVASEILFKILFNPDRANFKTNTLLPQADESLNVLINGSVLHLFFAAIAVCLALYSKEINKLFENRVSRIVSLTAAFVCGLIYMTVPSIPYLREAYIL
jgi:H+/Cl- antiporter ClcA